MYYDNEQNELRQQIKQRYNRRFFLIAHIVVFLVSLIVIWIAPDLRFLSVLLLMTLILHGLFVAYREYRDWLVNKVERELYTNDRFEYVDEKRKRYPEGDSDHTQFRLTDDGEIEPVYSTKAKRGKWNVPLTEGRKTYQNEAQQKRRKKPKQWREDDTDEFDVKKLLKKLKDIVD